MRSPLRYVLPVAAVRWSAFMKRRMCCPAVAISAAEASRRLHCYLGRGFASFESLPTIRAWRSEGHRLLREGWRIVAQTVGIELCFRPARCESIGDAQHAEPALIAVK